MTNQKTPNYTSVIIWLLIVCGFIFAMVVVGGVTRLTHSGLSMVDWRPIMGAIPPLSEAEWMRTFEMYKQYPEYIKMNKGMSLAEFKGIFFWEYGHRLLGRTIGLVFFLPFLYFWIRRRLNRPLLKKLGIAFLIGGLQGLMGWYMVMSGLVDMPRVSHYRLAAHLSLALFLLAYLFWIAVDLMNDNNNIQVNSDNDSSIRSLGLITTGLLSIQIVYGAFTAGLRAGWGYNTFPTMNGEWFPEALTAMTPFWLNFVENNAGVQFMHRLLGTLLLLVVIWLWSRVLRSPSSQRQRFSLHALLLTVIVQYCLGVYLLLAVVPLVAASVHQAVACLVLLAAINVNFQYRRAAVKTT